MEWLIDNWCVILAVAILIVTIVFEILVFFNMPKQNKIRAIKKWLRYAVALAEQDLGRGTGQLKLHKVYAEALEKFPWIATVYSVEQFEDDVDDALKWLKEQLDKNEKINDIITKASEENA